MSVRRFEVIASMREPSFEIEANIDREGDENEVLFYIDSSDDRGFIGVMRVSNEDCIAFCEKLLTRLK